MNIKGTINATSKYQLLSCLKCKRNYLQPLRLGNNQVTLPEIRVVQINLFLALVYALYKFVQSGWHLENFFYLDTRLQLQLTINISQTETVQDLPSYCSLRCYIASTINRIIMTGLFKMFY
jgi:hypothetical protein